LSQVSALFRFFGEAWEELKRVSWLSRNQMLASTWLVILFVIVFAVFVGFLDMIVAKFFAFFI
jgi:preprotein translocase subunit SecE